MAGQAWEAVAQCCPHGMEELTGLGACTGGQLQTFTLVAMQGQGIRSPHRLPCISARLTGPRRPAREGGGIAATTGLFTARRVSVGLIRPGR